MANYPYSKARTDPAFNIYISKEKDTVTNTCDYLKKKKKNLYDNVVLKLQGGIAFTPRDEAILKEFAYTKAFKCDSNINTCCVTNVKASGKLHELFNIIVANKDYNNFITKQKLILTPDRHLVNLFSIIKHCQKPDSYPIRYLQWVNLNEHCKWITAGADDYERLCNLYNSIPSLSETPRQLYFAAYMDQLSIRLAKKLAPKINSYNLEDIGKIFNTTNYDKIMGITRDKKTKKVILLDSAATQNQDKDSSQASAPHHPLNLILYGPPGTGKTYNTLFHALAIINNQSIDDLIAKKCPGKTSKDILTKEQYTLFKDEFDEKVKTGQIMFTTFHQSMSYEDFIEGIKPIPVDDKIVAIHENNVKSETKITQDGDGTTTISNLSRMKYEVKEGIFKKLCDIRAFLKDAKNKNVQFDLENGNIFTIDKIEEAIVYCKNSQSGEVPVGIEEIFTLLKMNNKTKQEEEQKQEQSHLFAIAIVKKFLEKKNVIIIDEINRGNVAQIFGELITLIEDNKRLGNDEAITATLPYSQKPFGVPNNLYIIGTMNTADRSVEALDTALRRRFSFEEMMPKLDKVAEDVKGIPLRDVFKVINQRIAVLKDREHQIGHSYFMKCKTWEDIKAMFKNEIMPLLQEYFYGNYESIRLVLGEGFVMKETEKVIFAGGQPYDGDSDKTRYRLLTESEWVAMDENKLKNTIEKLLNKTNNLDAPDGTSSNL